MPRWHGFVRALTAVVLLASLATLGLAAWSRAVRIEGLSDYGEGTVLAVVRRIDREAISPDWLGLPEYTLAPYGPGYYFAVHAITEDATWKHSLVPGRLVSLAAMLATALVIGLAAGRATRSHEVGLAGAILFLASPLAMIWGATHRVDSLATFFGATACVAAGWGRRGLSISAVLIVAGSLVKQTIALSALGVFVWLLLDRRWRDAAFYAVLVAVLGLSIWLAVDRASGGFYFASALAGNLGQMSRARGFYATMAFLAMPVSVAALWSIWQRASQGRLPGEGASRYVVCFLVGTLNAGVLACRDGSGMAYFLEASALASLIIAVHGLRSLFEFQGNDTMTGDVRWRSVAVRAGLAILAMVLAVPGTKTVRERGLTCQLASYGQDFLSAQLESGERVLADGQHLAGVLAAGAVPVLNDPFYFRQMTEQGRASADELARSIERGEIDKLVLRKSIAEHLRDVNVDGQKWPKRVLTAMESRFVLESQTDSILIYRLADEIAQLP